MLRECTKLRSIRKFTPQRKAAIGMMDRELKYDRRQFICAAGATIAAARLGMIPFAAESKEANARMINSVRHTSFR
jgi:hypothetical protein